MAIAILPATATAGEPTLEPLPTATHALELTNGLEGEIWFHGVYGLPGSGDFIGSYRADGTLEEFPLSGRRDVGGLVSVPGGDLWFAEKHENKNASGVPRIGRVSTAGQFTDYKLGDHPGKVTDLAPFDGSIWFGVSRSGDAGRYGSIERLDIATGSVTIVVRFPSQCLPGALAATTDAILFVESCSRRTGAGDVRYRVSIDRLDPSAGKVSRLRLRGFAPRSLLVGGDGSVWFGTAASGFHSKPADSNPTVGRISPAGKLSEYPAPGARNLASATLGAEGRLWFPSAVPGHGHPVRGLNSIGPGGDLGTAFCIAADCRLEPYGLLTRPDGSIWFGAGKTQLLAPSGSSGIAQEIYSAAEAGFIGHFSP